MRKRDIRKAKIDRLHGGNLPRVFDLFSGCGGLSLGFSSAGYKLVGSMEFDPSASESYASNFFRDASPLLRELHSRPRDIKKVKPQEVSKALGLGEVSNAVDVIIGGPPCQAFSRIGRAKLREVNEHPEAFIFDPRANLYENYLIYVEEMQPLIILIENVPDILNFGGRNVAEIISQKLEDMGYNCGYTLLNAVKYGVPQIRERFFLVAIARELRRHPSFPSPTHYHELPKSYRNTISAIINRLKSETSHYIECPEPGPQLPVATNVGQAIGDLPAITCHLEGKLKKGRRDFSKIINYPFEAPVSNYARLMRNWPGYESDIGVKDHVIRSSPRDYSIFRLMKPGDVYPDALSYAEEIFKESLSDLEKDGVFLEPGAPEYEQLRRKIVPPYDSKKYLDKWRKLNKNMPSHTVMAHLSKDCYSHIHYDSTQARTISVREAARLQSFPDGFVFGDSMSAAFRQIGNAVPPLLACALACEIRGLLGLAPTAPLLALVNQ